ncbi:MAG: thioredoxin family protein [Chitinophagaceae bacterium]|nr:thioredoxin family protein [Chitinophagaceae bacterium]
MKNLIDPKLREKGMSYSQYSDLLKSLMEKGQTTGQDQSVDILKYAKQNVKRMEKLFSEIEILPEVESIIQHVSVPQTWFVLTEGWCGDAAQIMPVINTMARANNSIEIKILLRDENLFLMDMYLQEGKRSIPKLIAVEKRSSTELFSWGPRPLELQVLLDDWVSSQLSFEEMNTRLHAWYDDDKTMSIQREIAELLEKVLVQDESTCCN